MTFLDQLEHELTAVGVSRSRRARILAELDDHLVHDPAANLGEPRALARQFADELGTRLARESAFRAFSGLAFAGVALIVMFLAAGRMRAFTIYGGQHHPTPSWAAPPLLLAALAAQVALAAGGLGLLRAWRLRHVPAISAADARILARRAGVGIASGVLTLTALPILALAFPHATGSAWRVAAWVIAAVGVVGLLSAVPRLVWSSRLQLSGSAPAGDLRDDLAPFLPWVPGPRESTLLLAGIILVVATVAGVFTQDPYDGALRGIADGLACIAGYAVLGRYLGLRGSRRSPAGSSDPIAR